MSKQVTCITKREHHNPHERIQGIGGVDGGVRWWRAEDDARDDRGMAGRKGRYVALNELT